MTGSPISSIQKKKKIQLRKLATNKLKEDLTKQSKYNKFWTLEFILIFWELDQSLFGLSHQVPVVASV